jgi:hypothetical protein
VPPRQRPFEPEHLAPAAAAAPVWIVEQGQQGIGDVGKMADARMALIFMLAGPLGWRLRLDEWLRFAKWIFAEKVVDRHV